MPVYIRYISAGMYEPTGLIAAVGIPFLQQSHTGNIWTHVPLKICLPIHELLSDFQQMRIQHYMYIPGMELGSGMGVESADKPQNLTSPT